MYVKQVKRKCNVRGCKNTDSFAISRTREVGNTVIVCKNCLEAALSALGDVDPKAKSNIPAVERKAVPTLFFNAEALGRAEALKKAEPEAEAEALKEEAEADEASGEELVCAGCGKAFDSKRGLQTHARYCKPQNEE